jgi:hypothetical protein
MILHGESACDVEHIVAPPKINVFARFSYAFLIFVALFVFVQDFRDFSVSVIATAVATDALPALGRRRYVTYM